MNAAGLLLCPREARPTRLADGLQADCIRPVKDTARPDRGVPGWRWRAWRGFWRRCGWRGGVVFAKAAAIGRFWIAASAISAKRIASKIMVGMFCRYARKLQNAETADAYCLKGVPV
jgi:hypothetical protein